MEALLKSVQVELSGPLGPRSILDGAAPDGDVPVAPTLAPPTATPEG